MAPAGKVAVQSPIIVLYIIQAVILLLVLLMAMIAASAASRPKPYRFWFHLLEALVPVAMITEVMSITGVRAKPVFLLGMGVIGGFAGLVAGLRARRFAIGGRLVLKRSGASWFFLVASYGLLAAAAWLLPKAFISAALGLVALATGAVSADALGRQLVGAYWSPIVRDVRMSPPYVPEEHLDGPVPATSATPSSQPLDQRPPWAADMEAFMLGEGLPPKKRGLLPMLGLGRRRSR